MTSVELTRISLALGAALDRFDWEEAASLCNQVIADLWKTRAGIPPKLAAGMLGQVRRKRQFPLLERLAQAFLLADVDQPAVRRQYAQALIEQGRFAAGEYVLRSMMGDKVDSEYVEAQGLIGRIYKQLYVEARGVGPSRCLPFLEQAISSYWTAYRDNTADNYWHGINVAALAARARADGGPVDAAIPPAADLAATVLEALDAQLTARIERAARDGVAVDDTPAFELATRVEALVAQRNFQAARKMADEYVAARGTDAFELGSTERQLREVWRLDTDPDPDAAMVLGTIRATLLTREGGAVNLTPDGAERAIDAAQQLKLEAVLGNAAAVSFEWYSQGLSCCTAVVQVQTSLKEGFGTGWIVDGGMLSDRWKGESVMVTNKHVISPAVNGQRYQPSPEHEALLPDEALVYHQLSNTRMPISEADVLWTSDDLTLDTTVVRLPKTPKKAKPLTISRAAVQMRDPPERVYVIGHPSGRGLEISLQDNLMLACNALHVHYRAPTEGGSSGSPVFDRNWQVIALHHGGGNEVRRLDQSGGRYAANEGIALIAVQRAIAAGERTLRE